MAPADDLSANAIWPEESAPGDDQRGPSGYDLIVTALARGIAAFTGHPVQRVEWGDGVRVHPDDTTMDADAALVTVPVAALHAGRIAFTPDLPSEKQSALAGLGMGRLGKLIAVYDDPPWPDQTSFVISDGLVTNWWLPGATRDDVDATAGDNNVIVGFAAERFWEAAESQSAPAVRELALEDLDALLGEEARDPLRFQAQPRHETRWVDGGYSYVKAGEQGAREALAAAVAGTLFFAGEATHATTSATTHGAIASGRRAARKILDTFA